MYKNILSFSLFLGLSLFIVSCSNPPETTLDTKTVITNGFKGGSWTKTDDITTHHIIIEPDGTFKKSTNMNFNFFMGYWSVNEPGKVLCKYPDGVTLDITVIDEDKFELNDEIYTLTGGYKGPKY